MKIGGGRRGVLSFAKRGNQEMFKRLLKIDKHPMEVFSLPPPEGPEGNKKRGITFSPVI